MWFYSVINWNVSGCRNDIDNSTLVRYYVDAKKLKSLLQQFDLIQHVNIPTLAAGNTFDLVISIGDISVKDMQGRI